MLEDKKLREVFLEAKKFIDDCEFRIPALYKVSPLIKFVKERNKNNKLLTGVEIGVYRGVNAYSILSYLSIKTLYLVDFYSNHTKKDLWNLKNIQRVGDNKDFEITREVLSKFKDKIQFVKKLSWDAINDVPDELDFVYIDGNHNYQFVKKDINLYYPKVKEGGVLGGHNFEIKFQDVPRAVFEFVDKTGLKLHGKKIDWWVVKEEK